MLRAAHADGTPVAISGGNTKRDWRSLATSRPTREISTLGLDAHIDHRRADRIVEADAGIPLARLQAELAMAEQMVGLDPPLSERATLGGILASADAGPWSHRYGSAAQQLLGLTVALADGEMLHVGAPLPGRPGGPDLTPLFCGSHGTLGVIVSATLALRPRPEQTATAMGVLAEPGQLGGAVRELTRASLELQALDVAWRHGRGGLLARVTGPHARRRAARAAAIMTGAGLRHTDISEQDEALWARQRTGQRSADRALVRISGRPSQLPGWLNLADACAATLIGRAGLGIAYLELDPERVGELRLGLPPRVRAELLDRPRLDPLAAGAHPERFVDDVEVSLSHAVKDRFDPRGLLNPQIDAYAGRARPGAV